MISVKFKNWISVSRHNSDCSLNKTIKIGQFQEHVSEETLGLTVWNTRIARSGFWGDWLFFYECKEVALAMWHRLRQKGIEPDDSCLCLLQFRYIKSFIILLRLGSQEKDPTSITTYESSASSITISVDTTDSPSLALPLSLPQSSLGLGNRWAILFSSCIPGASKDELVLWSFKHTLPLLDNQPVTSTNDLWHSPTIL